MTNHAPVPAAIRDAASINFTLAVTGYLFTPTLYGFCLVGRVFFDQKDRFKTGRMIRTSTVMEFIEREGYVIAMTWSGSHYVLVDEDGPWVLSLPEERGDGAARDC